MRLELAAYPVRHARLGTRASYDDGVLTIDRDAVTRLVRDDPRIGAVRLEIVHPGDSVRVLRALDAVEPLHKPDTHSSNT